jgi:hypothetical protein
MVIITNIWTIGEGATGRVSYIIKLNPGIKVDPFLKGGIYVIAGEKNIVASAAEFIISPPFNAACVI